MAGGAWHELAGITTLAATLAFHAFDRMGLDPAWMSTPFITTCTDVVDADYLQTAAWLVSHLPQLL